MNYIFPLFFLVLSFISTQLTAQEASKVNMKFYHLKVAIALDKPHIEGLMSMEYLAIEDNVTSFYLDLNKDLIVSSIEGAKSFEQKGDKVFITLAAPLSNQEAASLQISYKGPLSPRKVDGLEKGLIYSKHGKKDNPVIVSSCYPNGGYLWFPCKKGMGDKVDSMHMDITIPDTTFEEIFVHPGTGKETTAKLPVIAVSNGILKGIEKSGDGTKTFKWRHSFRIAPHHTLLAISNFMKIEKKFRHKQYPMPINFYILPENYKQSKATINRASEIITCLTNTFGPYPFRKEGFSITEAGINLGIDGMPTQGNISLTDLKSTNMYKVVHQAASMWFGNHISALNYKDAWIQEAISTYAEAMWQEYKRGLTVYQMILDEKEYFDGGTLILDDPKNYNEALLNQKGMYVIHMLRGMMGDEYFFQALQAINNKKLIEGGFSKSYLSTENFKKICEYYASENKEQDYADFFKQWVYGEYYPTYAVEYSIEKNGTVDLNIQQKTLSTTPGFFKMPIKIGLLLDDGTMQEEVIVNTAATQSFQLKGQSKVSKVFFDPNNWIFKNLSYSAEITNPKYKLEGFDVTTKKHRRSVVLNYSTPKKQDITIQLIKVANGITLKEDQILDSKVYKKESGAQLKKFEIPVKLNARGVFKIRVITKGATYEKTLRLKRIKKAF